MDMVSVAKEKIGAALAEGGGEIDGIITTAWNPTLAGADVLTDWHKDPAHKRIRFVGLDTAPSVLKAIEGGSIDATVAQNVFAHGYLSTTILKLMLDGWTPVKEYQFIDSGIVIVTKANVGTYERQLRQLTAGIASNLKGTTRYLKPPAGNTGEKQGGENAP
jgi:ribose transport system substrate-binding protein